jgi:excisionase family DNA binding protein
MYGGCPGKVDAVLDNHTNSNSVVPLLLTKKAAAHLLSLSLRTVDNLISTKQLPVRRIGRRVLIPRTALVRFCASDHRICHRSYSGREV